MRKLFIILFAILLASCASTDNIPTVSVTGSASVSMLPDMLSFTVTASRTAETTEEARSTVSMMINSAVEILQNEYAVDDDDIVTAYVSVSPEYSWKDGESILLGQRAVQSVDVTLHDIDAAGKVFQSLSSISLYRMPMIKLLYMRMPQDMFSEILSRFPMTLFPLFHMLTACMRWRLPLLPILCHIMLAISPSAIALQRCMSC